MKDGSKTKKTINAEKIRAVIARVLLVAVACAGIAYAAGTDTTVNDDERKLKNGSFEEGQNFTKDYLQPDQSAVPSWNTTAFEGKIELFKKNTTVFY